jgi:hypothetical protein
MQMDRQTGMTKFMVAFHNFANVSKKTQEEMQKNQIQTPKGINE